MNGATWAVRCVTEDLPKAAAVQIVEDVGYMPMDAVTVQKNQPNQTMLASIADTRSESLEGLNTGGVRMRQIPVIFRERWQLYQTEEGKVYAFDLELLKLIDFKEAEPSAFMSGNGHLGIFFWGDSTVYIAPNDLQGQRGEDPVYRRPRLGEPDRHGGPGGQREPVRRGQGRAFGGSGGVRI